MKGLATAQSVLDQLREIELPDLERPPVPDTHPTEGLVKWGIQVYSYAVLAHIRELLRAILLLDNEKDAVAVYALTRQLLEWTAHACYVSRNLKNFVDRSEWQRAWNWLTKSILGNLWIPKHAEAIKEEFKEHVPELPNPLSLASMLNAYNAYQKQMHGESDAQQNYDLLSEYAHASGTALRHYYDWKDGGRVISFSQPTPRPSGSFINVCLIDLLQFLHELLKLSGEQPARIGITKSMKQMIAAAERAGFRKKSAGS